MEEDLDAPKAMKRIAAALGKALARAKPAKSDVSSYRVEAKEGGLVVTRRRYGLEEHFEFGAGFFKSSEYRGMIAWSARLREFERGALQVAYGESEPANCDTFAEAVAAVFAQVKKGVSIQRYKGLGEMNPEQLWETTMDPAARRLLQVTLEDAVGADEIFTTLMGDQVGPRRDFIRENAFSVVNLDV